MTEKDLLHKRERKARRRRQRKKEEKERFAKDPTERAKKELSHLEKIQVGVANLQLLLARSEDVAKKRRDDRS